MASTPAASTPATRAKNGTAGSNSSNRAKHQPGSKKTQGGKGATAKDGQKKAPPGNNIAKGADTAVSKAQRVSGAPDTGTLVYVGKTLQDQQGITDLLAGNSAFDKFASAELKKGTLFPSDDDVYLKEMKMDSAMAKTYSNACTTANTVSQKLFQQVDQRTTDLSTKVTQIEVAVDNLSTTKADASAISTIVVQALNSVEKIDTKVVKLETTVEGMFEAIDELYEPETQTSENPGKTFVNNVAWAFDSTSSMRDKMPLKYESFGDFVEDICKTIDLTEDFVLNAEAMFRHDGAGKLVVESSKDAQSTSDIRPLHVIKHIANLTEQVIEQGESIKAIQATNKKEEANGLAEKATEDLASAIKLATKTQTIAESSNKKATTAMETAVQATGLAEKAAKDMASATNLATEAKSIAESTTETATKAFSTATSLAEEAKNTFLQAEGLCKANEATLKNMADLNYKTVSSETRIANIEKSLEAASQRDKETVRDLKHLSSMGDHIPHLLDLLKDMKPETLGTMVDFMKNFDFGQAKAAAAILSSKVVRNLDRKRSADHLHEMESLTSSVASLSSCVKELVGEIQQDRAVLLVLKETDEPSAKKPKISEE